MENANNTFITKLTSSFRYKNNHSDSASSFSSSSSSDESSDAPVPSSSVCIRYDFNKEEKSAKPNENNALHYPHSMPLFTYLKQSHQKMLLNNNIAAKENTSPPKINNGHGKPYYDTPLSPESHKKELCTYLQLMKPTERKKEAKLGNRRSKRFIKADKGADSDDSSSSFEPELLPLPPAACYSKIVDFDEAMKEILGERRPNSAKKARHKGGKMRMKLRCPQSLIKRSKFRNLVTTRKNSLRSKGLLRNVSLKTLISRKRGLIDTFRKYKKRKKAPAKVEKEPEDEIIEISVPEPLQIDLVSSDDEETTQNAEKDAIFNKLLEMMESGEQTRFEDRLVASGTLPFVMKQNFLKLVEKNRKIVRQPKTFTAKELYIPLVRISMPPDHDYAQCEDESSRNGDEGQSSSSEEQESEAAPTAPEPEIEPKTESPDPEITPLSPTLHLQPVNKMAEAHNHRNTLANPNYHYKKKLYAPSNGLWTLNNDKKQHHAITLSHRNGAVLKLFYIDHQLIVVQTKSVGIWTQSALGAILGAQDMWIPKGETERLPFHHGTSYMLKQAPQMVISMENSVAYVELWMKEHKSDFRERPLADVFATVYSWRARQNGGDKKALQLESVQARFDDVHYVVVKATPRIIVCWHEEGANRLRRTKVRSYFLASDYQTVESISEIREVAYYVTSLHNIEDCDNLIMGYGDEQVTLWNLDYGNIVATIRLDNMESAISTPWIQCDRGFLFMVQECEDHDLRLIAINGLNYSWKKLQGYSPPAGFNKLKGVYVENGLLVGYFEQGVVCWNAQSGQLVLEEVLRDEITDYVPSQKYIIITSNEQIIVRHSLSHLITSDVYLRID